MRQQTTYRLLSPAAAPPIGGNLTRDGFGFGSILSGGAPNSAVVAQHDRQLEQIVQDDSCLLRAKEDVHDRQHASHHRGWLKKPQRSDPIEPEGKLLRVA